VSRPPVRVVETDYLDILVRAEKRWYSGLGKAGIPER